MASRNLFSLFSGKTILVVDDSDMNNSVVKAILERYGVKVLLAQNGAEALSQFSESKPFSICAILMDIAMPVMNGFEAAKKIRTLDRPDSATTPIIAVTASVEPKDKKSAFECGMTDFLTKPIVPETLCQTIGRYLE
ncbi:MAG: response regulator [Treponema sp.]|nr:response regulator [Treponema sp.]